MAKRKVVRKKASTKAKPAKKKISKSDAQTLKSLNGMADGVVRAADRRRDLHIDIPSRTLSNVKYSPRKRILEMGNNTNRRQLFNLSQAKAYMQTMLVGSGCKRLIEQGQAAEHGAHAGDAARVPRRQILIKVRDVLEEVAEIGDCSH